MNKRFLIVNADDFGINQATNAAVKELFEAGRISSASVLATAPYAMQAIAYAKSSGLSTGVHWALNSDWQGKNAWPCAAPPRCVPSLIDADNKLLSNLQLFAKRAKTKEVTAELAAQLAILLQNGLVPCQADSHCGTLYGFGGRLFFINAFRLCKKHRLPFRLAKGDNFLQRQFPQGVPPAVKLLFSFAKFYAEMLGVPLIDDMFSNPQKVAQIETYQNLESWYLKEIAATKPGITELFLHPALPDAQSQALSAEWQKRVWEYSFLKSKAFMQCVQKEGIEIVSYKTAPF